MTTINYIKECSSLFTIARVFSLISIVSAHINFQNGLYALSKIYSIISSIGVIAFLFMSAYFYKPEKFSSILEVLKSKFINIGIPWLFLGSISYLYNAILSRNLSPIGWLKWIVGYNTYLYYLTILFICFIVFYYAKKLFCFCCIPLTLLSLLLTTLGYMDSIIHALNITHYLNIFNWIGIFALGKLCQGIEPKKIYGFFHNLRILWIFLFFVFAAVVFVFDIQVGYFSFVGIYLEIIGVLCVFSVSTFKIFHNKLFQNIANNSFTIYLGHMMVIGMVDVIYNFSLPTQIISNLFVIAICHFGLELCKLIIKKLKLEKILFPLFGFRSRKIG